MSMTEITRMWMAAKVAEFEAETGLKYNENTEALFWGYVEGENI